jgi:PAS domain S-box-containing protein
MEGRELNRIMLVDDEAIITMQLEKRLSTMGYEVVGVASSGEESVHMARKLKPDLVLMDIVMPGRVDGIDAASRIRSELDIPIIFLTAFADEANINRAKGAEPFGYIVKPFHEEEVRASIEVALHKRTGEKRLRENEKLFQAIMEEAFDPIVITDSRGNILELNKRAEQLLKRPRQHLLGTNIDQYNMPGTMTTSDVSYNGHRAVLRIMGDVDVHKIKGKKVGKLFRFHAPARKNLEKTGHSRSSGATCTKPGSVPKGDVVAICASCKKIRHSGTRWISVESFFQDIYGMDFNHGICSECAHKLWPDMPQGAGEKG